MKLQRLDPHTATEDELAAVHRFAQCLRVERSPHDAPLQYGQFLANLRSTHPTFDLQFWVVWNDAQDEVWGRARIVISRTEDNKHLVLFEIMVLPAQRRQGIGTQLLGMVAEQARATGRQVLVAQSFSTAPAGEAFLRSLGAQTALAGHTNELQLASLDRSLLTSWIVRAQERASGFELGFWEGAYPEDRLEEVSAMLDAFNTQPLGDLDLEIHFTPEQVRQRDAMYAEQGVLKWTYYVQEQATGTIAGFTEVLITRSQPEKVEQGLTAVFPPFRNKGLARWLKAVMVERILAASPETRVISSDNADVNEAMLKINEAMGFRPVLADTTWQLSLAQAEAVLTARRASQAGWRPMS